jgi:GcrA cell cycle regulator
MCAWTEERVKALKQLWNDGLSASQIANRLGGISRNAVIGKVHRLGLAGRAPPSRRRQQPLCPPAPVLRMNARVSCRPSTAVTSARRFVPSASKMTALALMPSTVEEANISPALRVNLLELDDRMCRWPVGEPQDENFHFCGRRRADGIAYCPYHARIAFQPMTRRSK